MQPIPLAVDLDGTLTHTDTLHESALLLLRKSPLSAFQMLIWLMDGKAKLKSEIANRVILNPETLPYNLELLSWLKEQKIIGRRLILCSATNQSIANSVASHLGIFDDVIASDDKLNIASANKRKALEANFGEKGYDYAGNAAADIEVWKGARKAIVVNANRFVVQRAHKASEVEKVISSTQRQITHWLKALRVHQWLKNLLLFVPLLAAHQLSNAQALETLILAFISFSTCASMVYIINDLLDLESDRQHPRKRNRPFAAGIVPVSSGAILAPLLGAMSLALALVVGPAFFACLIVYFTATTVYSFALKRFELIDCLTLAGLYTLRIIAGAAAVNIPLSFWLLAFSIFIFLSLAFVKRYAELEVQAAQCKATAHGRGYRVADTTLIQSLGVTSGYASIVVLALYLNSETVINLYTHPQMIWLTIPLMLFWISRMWMKAHRGQMHDDPIVFAIKDKTSLVVGLLLAMTFILATR